MIRTLAVSLHGCRLGLKKEKEAEKNLRFSVNISCLTQIPRADSITNTLDFQQANMS